MKFLSNIDLSKLTQEQIGLLKFETTNPLVVSDPGDIA
jgi:hypothetical protein